MSVPSPTKRKNAGGDFSFFGRESKASRRLTVATICASFRSPTALCDYELIQLHGSQNGMLQPSHLNNPLDAVETLFTRSSDVTLETELLLSQEMSCIIYRTVYHEGNGKKMSMSHARNRLNCSFHTKCHIIYRTVYHEGNGKKMSMSHARNRNRDTSKVKKVLGIINHCRPAIGKGLYSSVQRNTRFLVSNN